MRDDKKMKQITHENWSFYNMPPLLTKKDYETVMKEIKEELKKINQEELSIYFLGGISDYTPGISDIDYVIFTNKITPELTRLFTINKENIIKDEVLFHDQLFIPISLARKSQKILFNTFKKKLLLVHGKKIIFEENEEEQKIHDDMRLLEDLVIHQVRNSYKLITKKINVRLALHKLKSLSHMEKVIITDELISSVREFNKKLILLRKKWFNNKIDYNINELKKLIKEHLELQDKVLKEINDYYTKKYLKEDYEETTIFLDPENPIIFKKEKSYLKETKKIYEKTGLIIPVLPPALAMILMTYENQKGELSTHIRKHLQATNKEIKIKNKTLINKIITERNNFYEEHLKYCRKNKLNHGPLVSFNLHENFTKKQAIKRKLKRRIKITRLIISLKKAGYEVSIKNFF